MAYRSATIEPAGEVRTGCKIVTEPRNLGDTGAFNLPALFPTYRAPRKVATKMPSDQDLQKLGEMLAEAKTIASRRQWAIMSLAIDQACAALSNIEANDGEKGEIATMPVLKNLRPGNDEW